MTTQFDTVCLHAFGIDPDTGDETYSDGGPNDPPITGWSIYARCEPDAGGLIEAGHDADFPTYEAARDAAETLATTLGTSRGPLPINEY